MKSKGIYIFDQVHWDNVFGPDEQRDIARLVDVVTPMQTRETIAKNPELLRDVNFIFCAWGTPVMDEQFLRNAPALKAVFYASGSVKGFLTEAFWDRGIVLSGANPVFAIPVAEYAISQILFCLKHGWKLALETKRLRTYAKREAGPGSFHTTVGLISVGTIARRVLEKLRVFDLNVIAFDPMMSQEQARELGIELCPMDEVFARADVVSVHTPWLKQTEKLIGAKQFSVMKQGASFINTSRGAVVDEAGLVEVFERRPDLFAVLDVTWPEPPAPESRLYDLPNVIITPHIAGCMGHECRRGGRMVVEELERFLKGEPLQGEITRERIPVIA